MTRMILGVFNYRRDADNTVSQLEEIGYNPKDISIILKDGDKEHSGSGVGTNVSESAATGVATGGVLGGIAGLLIGVGVLAIPGVGALLIAGPLAAALGLTGAAATTVSGALTGALAGGIVGALAGLGVPEEDAKFYEKRIQEGAILVAVPISRGSEEEVRSILEQNGADQIRSFGDEERGFIARQEEEYQPAYYSEVGKRKRR